MKKTSRKKEKHYFSFNNKKSKKLQIFFSITFEKQNANKC